MERAGLTSAGQKDPASGVREHTRVQWGVYNFITKIMKREWLCVIDDALKI